MSMSDDKYNRVYFTFEATTGEQVIESGNAGGRETIADVLDDLDVAQQHAEPCACPSSHDIVAPREAVVIRDTETVIALLKKLGLTSELELTIVRWSK
jgi:hypothetical protein